MNELEFHHAGVACTSIDAEATRLAPLGYVAEGAPFVDPIQGVRGIFLGGQAPRLELLEPLEGHDHGVLRPWLQQDVKLYHLAYQAPDFSGAIERLRGSGSKVVVAPVPAVAFGGRRIVFLMLRNRMLVELIEKE